MRSRVFAPSRQPELERRLEGIDEAYTELIVADQESGRLRPGTRRWWGWPPRRWSAGWRS
ncbi:hypothetical protein ACFQ0M_12435 [Kitasatospora aburaviensis]